MSGHHPWPPPTTSAGSAAPYSLLPTPTCPACGSVATAAGNRPIGTTEQDEIAATFAAMLALPTQDGQRKRASGTKPPWKVDPDHEAALWRHLEAWQNGSLRDRDSGAHPLVHAAWRCLSIAWQDTHKP